jgi:hypothetical protein
MDNEREFQGQGNEANMSASKTCNAAPNEESQLGGQRSGFDVATTRPQTELNQAAEIGVSLPKADTAGHQTAVESRQSGAARSEVASVPAAPSSDPATRTGYAEREASGGDDGPALQAGKELPAGQHEGSRTPVTDSHGRTANDPDSAGVKLTAPVQPSGELAAPETMTDNPSYGPFADIDQTRSRPRRRWVWWVVVGVGVLGLVIGPIGVWLTTVWFGGLAQLQSAMAEADAIYPHWRWEDLIRQREQVPPEENAWPLIEQIAERWQANPHKVHIYPRSWFDYTRANSNRRFPAEWAEQLCTCVEYDPVVLKLFERLLDFRRAQSPLIPLGERPLNTIDVEPSDVEPSEVQNLLKARFAWTALHEYYLTKGCYSEAERILLAMLKLASAGDDGPYMFQQLWSLSSQYRLIIRLDRHLAMGELRQETHKELRGWLEKSLSWNRERTLWVIRGARATTHEFFERARQGRLSWTKDIHYAPDAPGSHLSADSWITWFMDWLEDKLERNVCPLISYVHQHRLHAQALAEWNRLELAAHRSEEELDKAFEEIISRDLRLDYPWWYRSGLRVTLSEAIPVGPCKRMVLTIRRAQIQLEVGMAGLAAEEFRIRHGRLPSDWHELVPSYLPYIPHDPYSGGPCQFKTTADGIVIYSVGTDRKDDGGDPERDIVFRVYHRDKRGRPPVPVKPSAHP